MLRAIITPLPACAGFFVKGQNNAERWVVAGSVHDACAPGRHLIEALGSKGSTNFVVELDGATQIVCSDEDETDHRTHPQWGLQAI
jgi:hypothetical protein